MGFKILNFNIYLFIYLFIYLLLLFFFWGGGGGEVQKTEYFWGMKILWIFLGGHHKLEVISMHFRVFSGALF